MTTRIADIINRTGFSNYSLIETKKHIKLLQSPAVVEDDELLAFLQSGGKEHVFRGFNDLADTGSRMTTSDPAQLATHDKMTSNMQRVRKMSRNKSWATANLVSSDLALDVTQTVATRIAPWVARDIQSNVGNILRGVFASNVTNNGGDMIRQDLTAVFSRDLYLECLATMGDVDYDLVVVLAHPAIKLRMEKQNGVNTVRASDETDIDTYRRQIIIPWRGAPVNPNGGGANIPTYTTAILGPAAIRMALMNDKNDGNIELDEKAGNGGGVEVIYKRWAQAIAPAGFDYVRVPSITEVEGGPEPASLALGSSWLRTYTEREQLPYAFLECRA